MWITPTPGLVAVDGWFKQPHLAWVRNIELWVWVKARIYPTVNTDRDPFVRSPRMLRPSVGLWPLSLRIPSTSDETQQCHQRSRGSTESEVQPFAKIESSRPIISDMCIYIYIYIFCIQRFILMLCYIPDLFILCSSALANLYFPCQ